MAYLEVKNLKKNYKMQVLKGVDFSLEKGEVLAIIGSSGGGKTTLLRCLTFLETANEGQIFVDGNKLFDSTVNAKENADDLRKKRLHFGLVFQQFNLFPHYNVLSNVELAAQLLAKEQLKAEYKNIKSEYAGIPKKVKDANSKQLAKQAKFEYRLTLLRIDSSLVGENSRFERKKAKEDAKLVFRRTLASLNGDAVKMAKLDARFNIMTVVDRNAHELLKRVGLADKAYAYPGELSGGQQQRVAIARALALHPDILCFDEPTSALDPELTGEVLKVIKSLKSSDTTMIIVTHEMEFARNVADKVMFISDGVIEEFGTPEQVFDAPTSDKTRAFLRKSMEKI